MAVTFKVPKSPNRDIVATDTFMGVDLTNTGVSMDVYRSPNAPNMVRDIPGKVRKRMGYYKEIYFGPKTNINYAEGTSAEEKEYSFGNATEKYELYKLTQTIDIPEGETVNIYFEFDYKTTYEDPEFNPTFTISASEEGATPSIIVQSNTEWTHCSRVFEASNIAPFDALYLSYYNPIIMEYPQSVYIKNFSLMLEKDSNYKWTPAPKYLVERETVDPIYGCHFLKNGAEGHDGDRVINVNRVLGTKSEYDEFTLNYTAKHLLYKLAEAPYSKQKIYLEFDYELTVDEYLDENHIFLQVMGESSSLFGSVTLIPTTTTRHISVSFNETVVTGYDAGIYFATSDYSSSSASVLKIKNLSLMYEKDANYEWSPAPEDSKSKFYIKDMYNIYPPTKALIETYSKETNSFSNTVTETINIADSDKHADEYTYLSFDINTSLQNENAVLEYVELGIRRSNDDYNYITYQSDKNFKKKHIDVFIYTEKVLGVVRFIDRIVVTFKLTSGNTKANINISNIILKNFSLRDDFVGSSKWFLYHVGKDFYLRANDASTFTKVYSEANEKKSQSFQINDNSYIIDGKDIYEFSIKDGEQVNVIGQDNAFIPLVTFAKTPSGGGTARDPINMLQPGFYEQFIGESGKTEYQLSFDGLDDTTCKAWVLDANSNWNLKVEGTDFTVDRERGKIKFTTAPGPTPITGEDSVKILAYRTVEGYRDRVVKCTFGSLFGVNGACDRIFLSGNPEHPNWDFYSQYNDATYFPDTGYSVLGSAQSAINGYAIVSNYLATFKDGFDMSQSVFIREGDLLESGEDEEKKTSEAVFKLINTLQGEGVVSPYSFGYLETEPVFLTKTGIYAITEQDITGEKYSQNRSFYLDGLLRKEQNLKDAIATIYDNMYVLSLNNKLYVLDGLQATRSDKSEPYATRQYAGFLCLDIPATCIWTDEQICFGTTDGRICRFYNDKEALESYNDDGKPIYACWETPDLDDKLFYKNKTFRYFAVRLMKSIKTTVRLYSRKLGVWTRITEKKVISNPIDFGNLDFETFTFSVDDTEQLVHSKVRVKKVDKARFRIENDAYNEPFGLSDLALEYIQSGNYKG